MTQEKDSEMVYYTVRDDTPAVIAFYLLVLSVPAILVGLLIDVNAILSAGLMCFCTSLLTAVVYEDETHQDL